MSSIMSPFEESAFIDDNTVPYDRSEQQQKEFKERAEAWLAKCLIPEARREDAEVAMFSIYDNLFIDLTIPDGIASLFLTHKAEIVPWEAVILLWRLYFNGSVDLSDIWLTLYWELQEKYPPDQRSYTNRLTYLDLTEIDQTHSKSKFHSMRSIYWPRLHRNLPKDLNELKALENQEKTEMHQAAAVSDNISAPVIKETRAFTTSENSPAKTITSSWPNPAQDFLPISSRYPTPRLPVSGTLNESPGKRAAPHGIEGASSALTSKSVAEASHPEVSSRYTKLRAELAEWMEFRIHKIHKELDGKQSKVMEWYQQSLKTLLNAENTEIENESDVFAPLLRNRPTTLAQFGISTIEE